ncbi:MAG: DUF6734 family protein [Prevotella sp.]|nr:DUF6734 family protein [Prevotella sp.]
MKIVQSFWTGGKDAIHSNYGWQSPIDHYLSWIISCNQLRKQYDRVFLVTDQQGYKVLVEKLVLPYTEVNVCLDTLNCYNSNLWALAKIKAYSIQEEPFIHVDGDVFVWEPIDASLEDNDLIVQNREVTSNYYRMMWNTIRPTLKDIPTFMMSFDQNKSNGAYNMGIFGGNDIGFIKEYCRESFCFVDNNFYEANTLEDINFNIFFEQVLLHEIAEERNKKVATYINEEIGDNQYRNFGNFDEVPDKQKYLHLLGSYKKQQIVSLKMRAYVLEHYPEYYHRLENVLRLSPTLHEMNIMPDLQGIESCVNEYLSLLNMNESLIQPRFILMRDIVALKSARILRERLETSENFIIRQTIGIIKNKKSIEISCIDRTILLETLTLDEVVFDIIDSPCDKITFNKRALDYLDENFPKNERANYLETLWKRILMLTSFGIFVTSEIEKILYR